MSARLWFPGTCAGKCKLSGLALLAAVAALALAACGGDDGDEATAPAPGSNPIAREGDLAVRLQLDPEVTAPDARIRVSVENLGELTISFGLGNRVERYVDGSWQDVSGEFGPQVVPQIARILKPGESSGAGQGTLRDHVVVSPAADPGIYRVLKNVSGTDAGTLTPTATFEITSG